MDPCFEGEVVTKPVCRSGSSPRCRRRVQSGFHRGRDGVPVLTSLPCPVSPLTQKRRAQGGGGGHRASSPHAQWPSVAWKLQPPAAAPFGQSLSSRHPSHGVWHWYVTPVHHWWPPLGEQYCPGPQSESTAHPLPLMQLLASSLAAEERHEHGTARPQSESLKHSSYEQAVPRQPGGPQLGTHRPFGPIVHSVSAAHSVAGAEPPLTEARCARHIACAARWSTGTRGALSLVSASIPGQLGAASEAIASVPASPERLESGTDGTAPPVRPPHESGSPSAHTSGPRTDPAVPEEYTDYTVTTSAPECKVESVICHPFHETPPLRDREGSARKQRGQKQKEVARVGPGLDIADSSPPAAAAAVSLR
jgi:hypothetical protein